MPREPHSDDPWQGGDGSRPEVCSVPIEPARMLIVLPNWVGDLVLATPALRVKLYVPFAVPMLRRLGVAAEHVEAMTVANPARLLSR